MCSRLRRTRAAELLERLLTDGELPVELPAQPGRRLRGVRPAGARRASSAARQRKGAAHARDPRVALVAGRGVHGGGVRGDGRGRPPAPDARRPTSTATPHRVVHHALTSPKLAAVTRPGRARAGAQTPRRSAAAAAPRARSRGPTDASPRSSTTRNCSSRPRRTRRWRRGGADQRLVSVLETLSRDHDLKIGTRARQPRGRRGLDRHHVRRRLTGVPVEHRRARPGERARLARPVGAAAEIVTPWPIDGEGFSTFSGHDEPDPSRVHGACGGERRRGAGGPGRGDLALRRREHRLRPSRRTPTTPSTPSTIPPAPSTPPPAPTTPPPAPSTPPPAPSTPPPEPTTTPAAPTTPPPPAPTTPPPPVPTTTPAHDPSIPPEPTTTPPDPTTTSAAVARDAAAGSHHTAARGSDHATAGRADDSSTARANHAAARTDDAAPRSGDASPGARDAPGRASRADDRPALERRRRRRSGGSGGRRPFDDAVRRPRRAARRSALARVGGRRRIRCRRDGLRPERPGWAARTRATPTPATTPASRRSRRGWRARRTRPGFPPSCRSWRR